MGYNKVITLTGPSGLTKDHILDMHLIVRSLLNGLRSPESMTFRLLAALRVKGQGGEIAKKKFRIGL